MNDCEIVPSTNKDLIVLVTETNTKKEDIELEEKLNSLESLQMLSMVSGFDNREISKNNVWQINQSNKFH